MIQFKEDGTGVYYNPSYTYVFTYFSYSFDSKNDKITINTEYSISKDGEKIKLDNKKCSISVVGDGMIFFNPFDKGSQVSQSYSFTRA